MSSIAKKFPLFEREAVARMLAPLQLFQIDISRLKRVFDNLARGDEDNFDKRSTVVAYLESMLPFILKEFLKQDASWKEFPFQLLDCDDAPSFFSKYEKVLLPVVLWYGKSENGDESKFLNEKLLDISAVVQKEVKRLLVENFAELVSFYLPTVVALDKKPEILKNNRSNKFKRAQEIHEFMEKSLTNQKYFALMNSFMPEILSSIFKQVQDIEHVAGIIVKFSNNAVDKNLIDNLLPDVQVIWKG